MYWKMGVSTEPGFLILGKDNTDHNPETIDGIVVKHNALNNAVHLKKIKEQLAKYVVLELTYN